MPIPTSPKTSVIVSVSTRNISHTKGFCAPRARMVPISPVRSITEMTRVFMMIITATTTTISTAT